MHKHKPTHGGYNTHIFIYLYVLSYKAFLSFRYLNKRSIIKKYKIFLYDILYKSPANKKSG